MAWRLERLGKQIAERHCYPHPCLTSTAVDANAIKLVYYCFPTIVSLCVTWGGVSRWLEDLDWELLELAVFSSAAGILDFRKFSLKACPVVGSTMARGFLSRFTRVVLGGGTGGWWIMESLGVTSLFAGFIGKLLVVEMFGGVWGTCGGAPRGCICCGIVICCWLVEYCSTKHMKRLN